MPSFTTVVMLESPRFIAEPSLIYYVLRSRPVTVSCRATSAVMVNFKCVGQWVPPAQHVTTQGTERQPPYRPYVQVVCSYCLLTMDVHENGKDRDPMAMSLCFISFHRVYYFELVTIDNFTG